MVIIFFFILSASASLSAQTSLPDSKRNSSELYIYKAKVEDLRKIYLKDENPDENMLHSLVISYSRSEKTPPLPRGNYFIVGAEGNNLVFNDHTVDDFNFKVIQGEQLMLCLYDSLGNIIRDAEVKCGSSKLKFDKTTHTYNKKKVKNEQIIEVNNNGVFHYIEIEKYNSSRYNSEINIFEKSIWKIKLKWYKIIFSVKEFFNPDERQNKNIYKGFIVFNKPKYKPGETVKLKAYLTEKNEKLYNKPVDVRLYSYSPNRIDTTLIRNLSPYRPGMFQYEFKLSDSLNMKLDRQYFITFKINEETENALSGSFRYEEYELKSARFSIETNKTEFAAGDSIKIKVKATDENEMALYGGKVEIQLTPASVNKRDMNSEQSAFVPDVLWMETFEMNDMQEKEITIPNSIFPNGISLNFNVKCTYLSADNEKVEKSKQLFRNSNDYLIDFSLEKGILTINELHKGESQQSPADITVSGENGELILRTSNTLPYQLAAPWVATNIAVKTKNSKGTFSLVDVKEDQLGYSFYLRNNYVYLKVDNPANIPFWYTIRKKNKDIAKGYTTQLDYSAKDKGGEGYAMQLSYNFGKERLIEEELTFIQKNMSIEVSTPTTVFPGQTANVTVSVRDKKGKPVENADITAYSFTSKFEGYSMPNLSIKGTAHYAKQFNNIQYKSDENGIYNQKSTFTYERWKNFLSLDSIEYYKFLYPDILYCYEEPSDDGTTQIAPFLVINGALQGVHMLWIDERLYYVEQAQQLNNYLFRVSPGRHNLKFRTHDREVRVYNILIKEKTKTILSFDAGIPFIRKNIYGDLATPFALVSKLLKKKEQGALNEMEIEYLSTQLITVDNNFGNLEFNRSSNIELPAYINTGNTNYYLNHKQRINYDRIWRANVNAPILAGPFPHRNTINGLSNMATLYADKTPLSNFQIEGGYNYTLYDNYHKMKSWEQSPINRRLLAFVPKPDFNTKLLTEDDISNYFNKNIINNLSSFFGKANGKPETEIYGKKICRLSLFLESDQNSSLPKPALILIIPQDKEDIMYYNLYYGGTRQFMALPEGTVNVHLIFGDTCSYTAKITLYQNGQNYLKLDSIGRDEDSRIAENAFNLLQQNLIKFYPQNPFSIFRKSTSTEKIVPAQSNAEFNNDNLLEDNSNMLEEVVVTAMGSNRKVSTVAAITSSDWEKSQRNSLDNYLGGRVAGVKTYSEKESMVRGIGNIDESTSPLLIIVNGLPYNGNLADLDQSSIISFNVLKDKEAISIYGSRAANGVIIIQTRKDLKNHEIQDENNGFEQGAGMRRNFHDDAFWQPALKTNEKGEATFEVTYPDDITSWNAYFLAIGNRKQADKKQLTVYSFKALTARLSTPRFAIRGDSLNAVGRIANHLNDSIEVNATTTVEGIKREKKIGMTNSHIEQIPVTVSGGDSVTIAYSMNLANGYFDGEERTIPIFEPGILQSFGEFKIINDTVTTYFNVNPDSGLTTLHAEVSSMDVFLREIEKIELYPYYCNEQMGSKIKTLLAKKKIAALSGIEFKDDNIIKDLISRLQNNRNTEGLWGWWNNSLTEFWISKQIIYAMLDAEKAGYKTGIDTLKLRFVLEQQLKDGIAKLPKMVSFEASFTKQEMLDRLVLLKTLNAQIDYPDYYAQIDYRLKNVTVNSKLKEMYLFSILGMKEKIDMDTLMHYSRKTILGSMFWGDEKEIRFSSTLMLPYNNNIETTLMAYSILKNLGGHEQELEKIRNYFFERRHTGSWQNTFEASRIIETILPDMLKLNTNYSEVTLYINDKKVTKFPFTEKQDFNQAVRIKKEGTLPLFVTVYQQEWNRNPKPESSKGFSVQTVFKENRDTVSFLKAGKTVNLEIVVKVDADADYVQIEVPIPAGCSYESKPVNFYRNEAHREHFKEKVSIFCNRLNKGEHRFNIELIPRFTGKYTLNPAKVELMYFPTFYGNEEIKIVEIN